MTAYYNDSNKFNCDWLQNLIRDGLIPPGEIDERPIQEVTADDVRRFTQRHWFAGVGGWAYALRLAGWPDDRPVDTGSCPCQPFSLAGKRQGDKDPRHLWPAWFRLLRVCRPGTILGEQVPGAIGHGWLDGVLRDLEREGYACGAVVLGAHSVGAPHIRQRIFWLANAPGQRLLREKRTDAAGIAAGVPAKGSQPDHREYYGRRIGAEPFDVPLVAAIPARLGLGEPELRRMARSARANQAGRLKAYGNSIVPQLAATFVRAAIEGIEQMTANEDHDRDQLPEGAERHCPPHDHVASEWPPATGGESADTSDAPVASPSSSDLDCGVESTDGKTLRCPTCGRQVTSLCCGHCGSRLPSEQADLYGAVVKRLAKLGGNRADATNKGGVSKDDPAAEDLPNDDGDTPTPQWPFDGPTVQCDEDGDDGVDQEAQDGDGAATEEPPVEPLNISDDELRKANDYAASFPDQFRALAVLEHVVCEHDAKDILTRTVTAARAVLTWGEIQEVVTAAQLKQKGMKVERL
jgi:DNA (cytosine-5)-methyltransferase 1